MKKPKEQTQPSYIDIINWYWQDAIYFDDYKSEYAVLFFALIDSINKNYWKETELEYDRIINKTKLSKRAYLDARQWLKDKQIIEFVAGKNEYAKAKFSIGIAVQNCTSTAPLLQLHSSSTVPLPFLQSNSTAPSIIRQERHTRQKDNKDFIAPTYEDFYSFCLEKGFEHIARKAFDYYSANDWKDNQNKPVKNWKLKLQSVWFDETKNPKPIASASKQNMSMSHELICMQDNEHKRPNVYEAERNLYYSECLRLGLEPWDYDTEKPIDLNKDKLYINWI